MLNELTPKVIPNIQNSRGEPYSTITGVALCRCGGSNNKPFCDGAHAGHCTDNLASVFKLNEEPWIDPDGATAGKIIDTIKQCPSGYLSFTVDNVEHRDQDREPMVTVTKNGPYAITGGIELVEQPQGEAAAAEHYALCRCGGSKNKPFCDGTHWHIGFKDEKN